jgi:hypothetical protein
VNELTELRERLHRLADDTAPPARTGLAEVIRTRHRARRRQRAGLVALVTAVAAVVVGGQVLIDGGPAVEPAPLAVPANGTDENAAVPESASLPPADVYGGPTRGSLADDAAFVEGVRRLPWSDGDNVGTGIPNAPLPSRHVVFAGDVGAARVALVAGLNTARPTPPDDDPEQQTDLGALSYTAVAWFVGPAGAAADEMVNIVIPYGVDPSTPTALYGAGFPGMVVVAAPGDTIEVSLRPDVAPDGTVHRTWQPVATPDGVGVVDLDGERATGRSLRYRVTRDGSAPFTSSPGTWDNSAGAVSNDPPSDVTWLRDEPPATPADGTRTAAVDDLLAWTALPREDVTITALWAGDVPAPTDAPARVAVMAVTLPSGAIYLTAPLGVDLGSGSVGGTTCGSGLLPAGTPAAELTVAVRCVATDMSASGRRLTSLVIVAPPDAVSANLLDPDGRTLAVRLLRDGVAVLPAPEGVGSVETTAADGTVLDRVALLGHATLGD